METKTIVFPATNRVHLARQQLLLDELEKEFNVVVFRPTESILDMSRSAILIAVEFNNFLARHNPDAVLIRGDRYEMLGLAMVSAYRKIPIIHIEGGDLSGVIDNKVRHAITHLADWHFCTNHESHARLIRMGVPVDRVWDYGSLDVEFAQQVEPTESKEEYIFVAHHPIEGEDENELTKALEGYNVRSAVSNKDYGRKYGEETFTPEEYVNVMRNAKCLVGNSSSFLKEASILGVPVVLVGERQRNRLLPHNVLKVPCEEHTIREAVDFQSKRSFEPDTIYYKPDTSKNITEIIKGILW